MVLFSSSPRRIALVALSLASIPAIAASYAVDSLAALQSRIEAAQPGDVITVKDGTYVTTAALVVKCVGATDRPVTIEARTVGGVEI